MKELIQKISQSKEFKYFINFSYNKKYFILIFFLIVYLVFGVFFEWVIQNYELPFFEGDYQHYKNQWQDTLNGRPYLNEKNKFNGNAYGPIHLIFSLLFLINESLPKLIYIFIYFLLVYFFIKIAEEEKYSTNKIVILMYMLLFSLPLARTTVIEGALELVFVFFVVLGLHFYYKKKYFSCGLFMSLGFLLKFINIVMLPFLVINSKINFRDGLKKYINFKILLSFLLPIFLVYSIFYFIFGKEIFYPFIFGLKRGSGHLSIYHLFETLLKNSIFIEYNLLFIFILLLILFIYYIRKDINPIFASVSSILVFILFLKLILIHYIFSIIFLLLYIYIIYSNEINKSKILIPKIYVLHYLNFPLLNIILLISIGFHYIIFGEGFDRHKVIAIFLFILHLGILKKLLNLGKKIKYDI